MKRRTIIVLILTLVAGGTGAALLACLATTVTVPKPAGPALNIAAGAFPHSALSGVLERVVDAHGRIDYKTLAAERAELERYLTAVAQVSPKDRPDLFPSREHALAYWLNAYNAYVLFAVTERPMLRSVHDENVSFFYGSRYRFGKETCNLHDLENEIIREEFNEPRVHMALNCASLGCPELPAEAFEPDRLEEQLAREAEYFCGDANKVRVANGGIEVSALFDWFAADFEADGGATGFCRKWGRLDIPEGAAVSYAPWDWALNAQPGKALYE